MPARKREAGGWWADDAASASGGHIAPAGASPDPLADAGEERTDVIPTGSLRTEVSSAPARRYGRRGMRPALRRVKRTVRHVDPLSVLKLSLFYYGCFLILWLLFVAVAYWFLAAAGVFDLIESIGRGLVLWDRVDITLWFVEGWSLLIGLTLAVFAALVNVLLAFVYNLAADVVGGIDVTFVERDI